MTSAVRVLLLAMELALRERDDSVRVLEQVRLAIAAARHQMEQLESYAAGTESKWALPKRSVAAPDNVRNYYQFMGRLEHAIALQRQAVADQQRRLVVAQQGLLVAEVRLASLGQLLEKKKLVIRKQQAGREQKEQDEFAALQYRRQHAGLTQE